MSDRTLIIVLFLLVLVLAWAGSLAGRASSRNDEVKSCVRNNVSRAVLYDFLKSAEAARERDARAGDVNSAKAAEAYRLDARRMVEAAAPLAARPGSPEVDCDEAFPLRVLGF